MRERLLGFCRPTGGDAMIALFVACDGFSRDALLFMQLLETELLLRCAGTGRAAIIVFNCAVLLAVASNAPLQRGFLFPDDTLMNKDTRSAYRQSLATSSLHRPRHLQHAPHHFRCHRPSPASQSRGRRPAHPAQTPQPTAGAPPPRAVVPG